MSAVITRKEAKQVLELEALIIEGAKLNKEKKQAEEACKEHNKKVMEALDKLNYDKYEISNDTLFKQVGINKVTCFKMTKEMSAVNTVAYSDHVTHDEFMDSVSISVEKAKKYTQERVWKEFISTTKSAPFIQYNVK